MSVHIREMSIDDYEELAALWESCEGICLREVDDARDGIQRQLSRNPGLCLVALDGQHIVGAALCLSDGRRGTISHLAVAADYRRCGIGRQLAEQCLSRLAGLGIRRCNIFIVAGNKPAMGFWQKLGWQTRDDLQMMSIITAE